ncbi:MAG TPA: SPASM domain-containing protein [Thermoguttaceae bacterium]|nr:SPASM domain-containing protein [Thermoguttaceae bacterium]
MRPELELLHIETTTDCNLRCRHCARRRHGYVSVDMSESTFCKIVPAIERYQPWINLSGHGETLIHPGFLGFFLLAANSGARGIEFQTNGLALTESLVATMLATNKWERLKVSIDGLADNHKWVRGVALENTTESIAAFNRLRGDAVRPGLTIEFCAMRHNVADMPDVVRLAETLKADRVVVGDLREYDGMEGQSLVDDWPAAEPHYRAAVEVADAARIDFQPSATMLGRLGRLSSEPNPTGGVCRIPWSVAFVDVAGKVRPCCVVDEAIGDLEDQSFDDAWFGDRAADFRRRFAAGDVPDICKQCTWT